MPIFLVTVIVIVNYPTLGVTVEHSPACTWYSDDGRQRNLLSSRILYIV